MQAIKETYKNTQTTKGLRNEQNNALFKISWW